MTANMIKGKSFRGALRYNLEKVEKGAAEVLSHSFVAVSEKIIMKEIQMIKVLRPNLQKYFYHTSINFPPSEDLSNEKMNEIGNEYLKAAGFNLHQFIMFRHSDADHPHLHILVNRIGYDGKVVSDSNDFARTEKILRELEKRYNLTTVQSSKQAKRRAVTKDELEMIKRTDEPSVKLKLQEIISKVLQSNPKMSTTDFIESLQSQRVNVKFNQASTGFVSGITYGYDGMIMTGSKLGNEYKWTTIKNLIDYDQQRDRVRIQETNVDTNRLHANLPKTNSLKRSTTAKRESQGSKSIEYSGGELKTTSPGLDNPIASVLKDLTEVQPDCQYDLNQDIYSIRRKRRKGPRFR